MIYVKLWKIIKKNQICLKLLLTGGRFLYFFNKKDIFKFNLIYIINYLWYGYSYEDHPYDKSIIIIRLNKNNDIVKLGCFNKNYLDIEEIAVFNLSSK